MRGSASAVKHEGPHATKLIMLRPWCSLILIICLALSVGRTHSSPIVTTSTTTTVTSLAAAGGKPADADKERIDSMQICKDGTYAMSQELGSALDAPDVSEPDRMALIQRVSFKLQQFSYGLRCATSKGFPDCMPKFILDKAHAQPAPSGFAANALVQAAAELVHPPPSVASDAAGDDGAVGDDDPADDDDAPPTKPLSDAEERDRAASSLLCADCIKAMSFDLQAAFANSTTGVEARLMGVVHRVSFKLQKFSYGLRCSVSKSFPGCMPKSMLEHAHKAVAEHDAHGGAHTDLQALVQTNTTLAQFGSGGFGGALLCSGSFTMMAAFGGF